HFLDRAYAQDGHIGLMLQTLLETGARASELVQLRVEDVSLVERVITIRQGKGGKAPRGADPARPGTVTAAASRCATGGTAVRQPPGRFWANAPCSDAPAGRPDRSRRGRRCGD